MKYPIPASCQEVIDLEENPVTEELVAAAIAGVINLARAQGQSLEELKAQVLADDSLLDKSLRRWLSDMVSHAWDTLPVG